MLRNTGFFRGIDCPFFGDYEDGRGGGPGCSRPYCHFRHSHQQHRRQSHGAPDPKKREQRDQGYDPFNPEVVHPPELEAPAAAPGSDISGALALVNRAIEEVRGQMEREKRKLSRIGDEPYDPSDNASLENRRVHVSAAASGLTYDPGSYQLTSGEYNPSPGCGKYTLDTDAQGSGASSMEYVPALPKKSSVCAVPSSKYNNSPCKYTLDNSKPSTDMEYDPLSNYSASIAGKSTASNKIDPNSNKPQSTHEEYVVSVKKTPINTAKYTFSDSDGESSGMEYKPTAISNLQLQKDTSAENGKEKKATENAVLRPSKDETNDLKKQDQAKSKDKTNDLKKKDQAKSKSTLEKKKKTPEHGKAEKTGVKESSKSKSTSSCSGKDKSSHHDSSKKENKSHGKKEERSKDKPRPNKEAKEGNKSEGKVKSGEKAKTSSSSKREREGGSGNVSPCKKAKLSDKEKSRHHGKNGEIQKPKHEGKSSSGHGKKISGKDKSKHSGTTARKSEERRRSLSLSHVDLFGDESPEEAEPLEMEAEEEEKLVRKCSGAVKWRLNKRKASELTPSSSEDEADGATTTKEDDVSFDLALLQDDFSFESDPLEECLRIFNESNDVKKEDKGRQAKQACRESEEEKGTALFFGQKKRVSHFIAKGNVDAPPKAVVRPYRAPSAQEVCYQRLQLAQQQAAQLSAAAKATSPRPSFSGEKRRIAHRPNPQATPSAATSKPIKRPVLSPSQAQPSVKIQTTAGIMSKTSSTVAQKRVAHTPTLKSSSLKRPIIPTDFGAKVPTNIRQRYLNTFIEECLKFCSTEEEAFQTALDEEKVVYERSSSKNIYLNVAVNTLKKLRSKSSPAAAPPYKAQGSTVNRKAQSHQDVLGGRLAATTSFTVNRKGKQSEEKLSCATLYHKLKSYLMSEEQLQENGYPRKDPEASGRAVLYSVEKKAAPADPFNKVCCRCGAEYKVSANGSCVRREECTYHWGRARRQKVSGAWEMIYSCCSGAVASQGCQVAKQHVQDSRKESLDGFVSTFSKPLPPDGNGGVFALDCEMCYTKQGLELTRVTVIDSKLKVIYDTFVKPVSKVVDYNTRFSGVTEEDLQNVSITLRDVQAVLLSMFSAESILLGHSLESDFLALKLIHSSVVDTAIVFPHRLGLPYKRALRNLMADHLKRIIQDNVGGHDSSEDASACMELMMWKIKEDAKVKR